MSITANIATGKSQQAILPFSISGAFLTLWLTGNSLNIFSLIGALGIVKKNPIPLLDFTNQVCAAGPSPRG